MQTSAKTMCGHIPVINKCTKVTAWTVEGTKVKGNQYVYENMRLQVRYLSYSSLIATDVNLEYNILLHCQ